MAVENKSSLSAGAGPSALVALLLALALLAPSGSALEHRLQGPVKAQYGPSAPQVEYFSPNLKWWPKNAEPGLKCCCGMWNGMADYINVDQCAGQQGRCCNSCYTKCNKDGFHVFMEEEFLRHRTKAAAARQQQRLVLLPPR